MGAACLLHCGGSEAETEMEMVKPENKANHSSWPGTAHGQTAHVSTLPGTSPKISTVSLQSDGSGLSEVAAYFRNTRCLRRSSVSTFPAERPALPRYIKDGGQEK